MMAKGILLFCAQALFIQSISAQCIGTAYDGFGWGAANGLGWEAAASPYGAASYGAASPCSATPYTADWTASFAPMASNGGGFVVNSGSPISVTGVALTSENAYEGALSVSGALPFLGAVALEGPLPTAGMGGVTYSCGNGNVAILNEDLSLSGHNGFASPYGPYGTELGYGYASPLGYETYGGHAYGYSCGY
ncbi:unnamed protein product [Euphydryas editha]|uniref:Uncharacterized protein n=1 Tax=Euphydryas editha TaxID=104508 RepID=A0AAU9TDA0_EUPED|nr:unnamed protein product [Euphydryas editha]